MSAIYGAIEAGGTKFVLACGRGPGELLEERTLPTTTPEETLGASVAWFREVQGRHGELAGIGVGTFGPAGVHEGAADWGWITTTPKAGWRDTDVAGYVGRGLGLPVAFDTDVNAAALGEWLWGAGVGCEVVLYLTVGTGIGGGVVMGGKPLHGVLHPEMGHVRTARAAGDEFAGVCPWHRDCLEGMASGPAIGARWGRPAGELPPGHEAWELEAHYLAEACTGFLCTLSPQRVILGGGVMGVPGLLERVRAGVRERLGGYLQHPLYSGGLEDCVVAPGLGTRSGILGALALARELVQPASQLASSDYVGKH